MPSDIDNAMMLKNEMKDSGDDYLTLTREYVKEYFGVDRLTNGRAERIVLDCQSAGLIMFPTPTQYQLITRVYLKDSDVGKLISSIISPAQNPDDEDMFESVIKKINSPLPRDVFRKIRDVFADEGWIKLVRGK